MLTQANIYRVVLQGQAVIEGTLPLPQWKRIIEHHRIKFSNIPAKLPVKNGTHLKPVVVIFCRIKHCF